MMSNKEFWCRHGNIMLTGEHCGACAAGDEPLGDLSAEASAQAGELHPIERPTDGRPWIPDLSAEALAIGGL